MTKSAQRAQQIIDVLERLLSCVYKIKTRDEFKIVQPINVDEFRLLFKPIIDEFARFLDEGGNPDEFARLLEEGGNPDELTPPFKLGGNPLEIPGVVAYTEEYIDKCHFCHCQDLGYEFSVALVDLKQLGIVRPADWIRFANQVSRREFDHNRIVEIASQITTMKDEITIKAGQDEPPDGLPDPKTPDDLPQTDEKKLIDYCRHKLKGKQRSLFERLIEGEASIEDELLALMGWSEKGGYHTMANAINKKLESQDAVSKLGGPWIIDTHDGCARLTKNVQKCK